jgi:hypothetical protein
MRRCIHEPQRNGLGGLYCRLCGAVLYMPPKLKCDDVEVTEEIE